MPLPQTAVFGGSSILMNLPRPFPSFTSGSSDLQVHGLPSGSKTISRMKLPRVDRKSTRLNSSHGYISYAVFCLKKKKLQNSMVLWDEGAQPVGPRYPPVTDR